MAMGVSTRCSIAKWSRRIILMLAQVVMQTNMSALKIQISLAFEGAT